MLKNNNGRVWQGFTFLVGTLVLIAGWCYADVHKTIINHETRLSKIEAYHEIIIECLTEISRDIKDLNKP